MENIPNQVQTPAQPIPNPIVEGKTFTQDELNHIVGERLAKEKTKGDAEFREKETALEQRELRLSAKEMLTEKQLPITLLDALNCSDKKSLDNSISIIVQAFNEYKQTVAPVANPAFNLNSGFEHGGGYSQTEDAAMRKAMGLK